VVQFFYIFLLRPRFSSAACVFSSYKGKIIKHKGENAMKKLTTLILVLALSAALLVGCTVPQETAAMIGEGKQIPILAEPAKEAAPAGGVLRLKINPEIALHYDENGKVTKLEGRNGDGIRILEGFTGYEGKDTSQVLQELVDVIGKAGYFVEEADASARRIVLELDPGSQVPHETFLEDMAVHVKACVESKTWVGEREFEYAEPVPETAAVPKETAPAATAAAPKETAPAAAPKATGSAVSAKLCPVCADDDCDDGKYCDDWDDKAENLREQENRKNNTPCTVCGEYDCDDGKYCDDWDERYERDDDRHHGRHHDD
jgi:hypothetical protein